MISIEVFSMPMPLAVPYRLSFALVERFDTFVVRLRDGDRIGYGEITPLPGYSDETVETVTSAITELVAAARRGVSLDVAIEAILARAPMTVSGIRSALDVAAIGVEATLVTEIGRPIPLAAFCPGDTPAEAASNAARLAAEGFGTLKLKIASASAAADLERLRAVAAALPAGVILRLDANQRLDHATADEFVKGLEGLPIELLEQPFLPAERAETRRLAAISTVPIMLDESVWTSADVADAAALGARFVKFKLCKHPGIAATRALIAEARAAGLGVVFGNGVQSALGNRLEAFVYAAEDLSTASEGNGFLKPVASPFPHRLRVEAGRLIAGSVGPLDPALAGRDPIARMDFATVT